VKRVEDPCIYEVKPSKKTIVEIFEQGKQINVGQKITDNYEFTKGDTCTAAVDEL